jgi:hypothetical protein
MVIMYQIFDYKSSDMLWKAYCDNKQWGEMPIDFQLRSIRDCLTIYGRNYENHIVDK